MFYTYVWLRENDIPYYVGKGKGNRGFVSAGHRVKVPPKERIVIYPAESEVEAFENEIALIWYYGRKDLGTGCLRNLTDGGENPPNNLGTKRSEETKRLMSIGISAAKPWKHGTKTGRINHRCTCELCLQWSKEKWQKDKEKILTQRQDKGLPLKLEVWNKGTGKGVYKHGTCWAVTFWIDGKLKHFGSFETEEDAKKWAAWIKP